MKFPLLLLLLLAGTATYAQNFLGEAEFGFPEEEFTAMDLNEVIPLPYGDYLMVGSALDADFFAYGIAYTIAADGTSHSDLIRGISDDGIESEFVDPVYSNNHFYLLENVSDPGYSFVSVTKIDAGTLEYVTEYTIIGDTSIIRPIGQHITADDDGNIYVSYRYPSDSEAVAFEPSLLTKLNGDLEIQVNAPVSAGHLSADLLFIDGNFYSVGTRAVGDAYQCGNDNGVHFSNVSVRWLFQDDLSLLSETTFPSESYDEIIAVTASSNSIGILGTTSCPLNSALNNGPENVAAANDGGNFSWLIDYPVSDAGSVRLIDLPDNDSPNAFWFARDLIPSNCPEADYLLLAQLSNFAIPQPNQEFQVLQLNASDQAFDREAIAFTTTPKRVSHLVRNGEDERLMVAGENADGFTFAPAAHTSFHFTEEVCGCDVIGSIPDCDLLSATVTDIFNYEITATGMGFVESGGWTINGFDAFLFGSAAVTTDNNALYANFLETGTYEICASYRDDEGCPFQYCATYCVGPPILEFCENLSVVYRADSSFYTFTADAEPIPVADGEWLINDTLVSMVGYPYQYLGNSLRVELPNPRDYTVCYPIDSEDGCLAYCCTTYCLEEPAGTEVIGIDYTGVGGLAFYLFDEDARDIEWYEVNGNGEERVIGTDPVLFVEFEEGACSFETYYCRYTTAADCQNVAYRTAWLCPPTQCSSIGYDYNRDLGGYDLFLEAVGATNIRWFEVGTDIFYPSTTTQAFIPFAGECGARHIGVSYTIGGVYYVCSLRYRDCDPEACGDVIFSEPEDDRVYLEIDDSFTDVRWTVSGAAAGAMYGWFADIGPGEAADVCIYYRDPADGLAYKCCREVLGDAPLPPFVTVDTLYECIPFGEPVTVPVRAYDWTQIANY